jgi:hypothetical protein
MHFSERSTRIKCSHEWRRYCVHRPNPGAISRIASVGRNERMRGKIVPHHSESVSPQAADHSSPCCAQSIDYRSSDGFFRKYRFFSIDDAIRFPGRVVECFRDRCTLSAALEPQRDYRRYRQNQSRRSERSASNRIPRATLISAPTASENDKM